MRGKQAIVAIVPSSTANLGPGFDVHSLALEEPSLKVMVEKIEDGEIEITVKGKYANQVVTDVNLHSGAKALANLMECYDLQEGIKITYWVNIPPKKGLGLSGAEAVGAVLCANEMYELRLSEEEIAMLAAKGEPSYHMDNVVASLKGGFNIIAKDPLRGKPYIANFKPPEDLGLVLIIPRISKVSTAEARKALPNMISKEDHISSLGHACMVSSGFSSSNVKMIIDNIAWDDVVEPARAKAGVYGSSISWKALKEEKEELLERFNVAETISGAGPSRVLWYSVSDNEGFVKGDRPIDKAVDYVINRIKNHGYGIEEIIFTRPSLIGARLIDVY